MRAGGPLIGVILATWRLRRNRDLHSRRIDTRAPSHCDRNLAPIHERWAGSESLRKQDFDMIDERGCGLLTDVSQADTYYLQVITVDGSAGSSSNRSDLFDCTTQVPIVIGLSTITGADRSTITASGGNFLGTSSVAFYEDWGGIEVTPVQARSARTSRTSAQPHSPSRRRPPCNQRPPGSSWSRGR